MKHSYLYMGLCLLFLIWSKVWWAGCLLLIVLMLYYRRHYKAKRAFYLFLLCVMIRLFLPMHEQPVSSHILQVKEIKSNYVIASTGKQKVIVYQTNNLNFNDVIEVTGTYRKIEGVHNFRMFYFPEWIKRRGISHEITAKSVQIRKHGTGIRNLLYKRVQKIADSNVKSWMKSMLYGIHEEDVSFFITSSGMHITLLFQVVQSFLLLYLSKMMSSWICFIGMGLLGYATVLSTSLLRMLCFRSVTFGTNGFHAQDRLGISMICTLFLFPYMAYELAFLIPLGFRLVQLFNVQKRNRFLMSYLVLIPIQYQFFHVCNPFQILCFRFLRSCYAILYLGALCSLITSTTICYTLLSWMLPILQKIESFGFTLYYTPHVIWLIIWVWGIMKVITYRSLKNSLQLCLLFWYAPFSGYFDPFGEILMIDVGQGDCTLIRLPFHQGAMLIDVMGSHYKNIPADIIVPVLKAKGIHKLDKVILTHDDFDHSGGLQQLQELMDVSQVITKKTDTTKLHDLNIPFLLDTYEGEDANENSIITLFEVYGLRVLFMGDAGKATETVLLKEYPKLEIDVLKVGHHGSKTASSSLFLHQLRPSLGLISCGRHNFYGHPHRETLDNLANEHVRPLISANDGAVSIKFCRFFSFYTTAEHEFGILTTNITNPFNK